MMLRQILIRSNLNLIGKGYEERKIKWVYLYPSYFFTPEDSKGYRRSLSKPEVFEFL